MFNKHRNSPVRTARKPAHRRGSMIVLAVGVLAALAIVAVAYTAAVRVERTGVQAYVSKIDANRQADVMIGEIGAFLTADLFGNKIVTAETPRFIDPSNPIDELVWPRMFEDGEFFDVPGVDSVTPFGFTFNEELPGDPPSPASVLNFEPSGFRFEPPVANDDAWLASTEPVSSTNTPFGPWDTWPNITNLRSAYRWRETGTGPLGYGWVRDDGRFADLGQFFLTQNADDFRRGDPDADLLADFNDPLGTMLGNGPWLGVDQEVFAWQMSGMYEAAAGPGDEFDPRAPMPSDERYWADTDGDLRPDARWQKIDALGDLHGLIWVAAVRIIDNSSMINVNTALEFGLIDTSATSSPADPYLNLGAGNTPADVDLLRLLRSGRLRPDLAQVSPAWGASGNGLVADADNWVLPPDQSPPNSIIQYGGLPTYDAIFREQHVEGHRRLHDIINSWTPNANPIVYDAYDPTRVLSRSERDRLFRELASPSLTLGADTYVCQYTVNNEIDLRTYWGVNREDTLSVVEQRLDAGMLPGQLPQNSGNYDSDTSAQLRMGPMRSADRARNARGYVLTGRELNNFEVRPTVEEIRDDIRRHITTVSGVSDASPVPVINDAIIAVGSPPIARLAYPEGTVNRKIAFSEFASVEVPAAVEPGQADVVRRAFESFVWALAPTATHMPVAASLAPGDVGTAAQLSANHYGGGNTLPADSPVESMEQTAGAPPAQQTYALLRAASLAVNLADAIDRSALSPDPNVTPTAETRESPTIARLFPQPRTPDDLQGILPATLMAISDRGIPTLSTRFSHGDITSALPQRYVGLGSTGVTLVGLDRQPFLREIASFAVYRDDLLIPASVPNTAIFDSEIIASRPDEQLGSIIAFELGNPWPRTIDVRDYKLRLASEDGARFVQIDLSGINAGDAQIPAGGYNIYYVYRGNPSWQSDWDEVYTDWQNKMTAKLPGVLRLGFDAAANTAVSFDTDTATADTSVMFADWSGLRTLGLIIYDNAADAGDPLVLVDRMAAPAGASPFPATLADVYGDTWTIVADGSGSGPAGFPAAGSGTGRIGIAASFTRRIRPPTDGVGANQRTGGFPAYIIERPEHGNDVSMGVPSENTWGIGTGPFGAAPTVNVDAPGNNLGPGPTGVTPGDVPKGELPGMPSIQFFVPNRAPDSVGDLAMLSAFTHMFVHASDDPPLPGWNPEIVFADPTTLLGVPEENHWVTVGEQLGADMHFTYDTLAPVLTTGMNASNANPYLGVLDPTRFVPGGDLQAPVSLPDALAVPLATRIYDCFRAVGAASPRESLVQGVVNVNTAPIRNLRMLPFMSPEEDIAWPSTFGSYTIDGSLDVPNMPEADRAALVEAYRSVSRFTSNLTQRAADLNITGLRDFGYAGVPTNGFVNIGELSILSDWDDSVSSPSPEPPSFVGTTYGHFGELGQRLDPMTNDRFNTGVSELPPVVATVVGGTPPAHIVAGAGIVDGVLDRYPNAIMATPDGPVNLDPIDDAEERAAVFRAMANSVSTRSDVYTAWFIVRGYNPSHISAIRFPPDASTLDDEVIAFMLNQLKPAHESRWLAVFDRSNVRLPTDRPKVLLLAPLPTR